jgi:hypothetical protein
MKIKDLYFVDWTLTPRSDRGGQTIVKVISARCGVIEIATIFQQDYHDAGKTIIRWYIRPTGILESAYDHNKKESIRFFDNREFKTEEEAKTAVEVAFVRFINLFVESV